MSGRENRGGRHAGRGRGQRSAGGRGNHPGGGRGRGDGSGRGRGRGGRGNDRPDLSGLTSCLSNIILANVSPNFSFYLYSTDAKNRNDAAIDSLSRRGALFNEAIWNNLLKDMPKKQKEDLERVVFFSGSFFYSARPIAGLEAEKLPRELLSGNTTDGDTFTVNQVFHFTAPKVLQAAVPEVRGESDVLLDHRCSECTKAFDDLRGLLQHCQETAHKPVYDPRDEGAREADVPVFLSYVNMCLARALGERLAKWGREYIDPTKLIEAKDRQGRSLGVTVYQAFSAEFGFLKPKANPPQPARLSLTVDLRAKLLRSSSVLDQLYDGRDPKNYQLSKQEQDRAGRIWTGETVIYKCDKRTYSIVGFKFDHSAASLPVEGLLIDGKPCSHAKYFKERKNINLQYPNAKPMVICLGRRKEKIFLPAELICGNELDPQVKAQLPIIASYSPSERNQAIESIRNFLKPGAQKTKGRSGLLPAVGISLQEDRLPARAQVLPVPQLMAAGVAVPPAKSENWAPVLSKANFNVSANRTTRFNVVIFYNKRLRNGVKSVYNKIRDNVNQFKAAYTFGSEPIALVETEDNERHWGAVSKHFSGGKTKNENLFVLDFTKPRSTLDPAYPVVKQMLTKSGYLSQFVNFNTYSHDQPRDQKRSNIILQGVARQILQKAGVRLWWVALPKSLPLPAVFVGVDVFHAPRVYDPQLGQRVAKASCAAIIVQVVRPGHEKNHRVELYSETFARQAGEEYGLQEALTNAVTNALQALKVNPMSCIVWRDGIGDSAFDTLAGEEIAGIRSGLEGGQALVGAAASAKPAPSVPMAYVVCQKRIATKFVTRNVPGHPDGKFGAPPGTLVEGIQGLKYNTFYIQGRAPPFSTPKPVRFIVVERDPQLNKLPLPELTWDLCHDYPNWPGSIKVPSVCQMAHKLAELGGGFSDCGRNIDHKVLANTVHFL